METKPLISVQNLSYAFEEGEGMKEVLHGISVDFQPGEIAIIKGPSGSGKTTLLKLIGGLRTVQKGSIVIDGRALEKAAKAELVAVRREIGFIFQAHHLLGSLNITQNVMMPLSFDPALSAKEARARAIAMLERVGLGDHLAKPPAKLSGGQKQRVAIARALVHNPKIILADEPTASLDGKTGREVVDILQKLSREAGATILLVTHDPRILDVADRIITLEDGSICTDTAYTPSQK